MSKKSPSVVKAMAKDGFICEMCEREDVEFAYRGLCHECYDILHDDYEEIENKIVPQETPPEKEYQNIDKLDKRKL